jgi:uncharacterized protein (DUF2249 family)
MNTNHFPKPIRVDVRPALIEGREPFGEIMAAKQKLQEGQSLLIIAPFQPLPLYSIFEAEGYRADSQQVSPEEWRILFTPKQQAPSERVRDLDLRVLVPPQPLEAALKALAELEREEILVLHTRFRPVHLFEHIDESGNFDYEVEEAEASHWITHVWRITK